MRPTNDYPSIGRSSVKPGRRGPSLFDVMSKAPVAQSPRERPRPSWLQRKVAAPVLSVAEPLTEEQAAAALAEQRVQDAPVPAKKAAKPKSLPSTTESLNPSADADRPPIVSSVNGRLVFNLSTAACVAIIGVVSAIALGGYIIGQRSSASRIPPVAARANNPEPVSSPLLPPPSAVKANHAPSKAAITNPDLSHLLQRPNEPSNSVSANKPAKVTDDSSESTASAGAPESLNYLQIESFRITRERSGDQLANDVAAVRQFLGERGVRTFARKRGNGFVLFAEQGFAPGKATARERSAFQRKIEQFGQEYRSAGGRYQFKGCLFVSYSATRAGDPV